ncbi:MAG: FtsX-like permease family protein [Longimicrobiales bacterium]
MVREAPAQRTREIGLRNALGAGRSRILGIVVARAVRITLLGIAAGVLVAVIVAPRIEDLLFETPARDPVTITGVSIVLLVTAILSAGLPAWRAARVDPSTALRAE